MLLKHRNICNRQGKPGKLGPIVTDLRLAPLLYPIGIRIAYSELVVLVFLLSLGYGRLSLSCTCLVASVGFFLLGFHHLSPPHATCISFPTLLFRIPNCRVVESRHMNIRGPNTLKGNLHRSRQLNLDIWTFLKKLCCVYDRYDWVARVVLKNKTSRRRRGFLMGGTISAAQSPSFFN